MKNKPDIKLNNGTVIRHRKGKCSAWEAYTDRPDGGMTDREWIEYVQILARRYPKGTAFTVPNS